MPSLVELLSDSRLDMLLLLVAMLSVLEYLGLLGGVTPAISSEVGRLLRLRSDLTGSRKSLRRAGDPAGRLGALEMLLMAVAEWNLAGSGAVEGGDGA